MKNQYLGENICKYMLKNGRTILAKRNVDLLTVTISRDSLEELIRLAEQPQDEMILPAQGTKVELGND